MLRTAHDAFQQASRALIARLGQPGTYTRQGGQPQAVQVLLHHAEDTQRDAGGARQLNRLITVRTQQVPESQRGDVIACQAGRFVVDRTQALDQYTRTLAVRRER